MKRGAERQPSNAISQNGPEFLLPRADNTNTPEEYKIALNKLIFFQENGVTHFYGGPLDLNTKSDVWVSPVEVTLDNSDPAYFQLLYVNVRPEQIIDNTNIPVTSLEIDEAGYKLAESMAVTDQLTSLFDTDKQRIFIRQCETGMAYFPQALAPTPASPERDDMYLQKLTSTLGIREPEIKLSLNKKAEGSLDSVDLDDLHISLLRRYGFGSGHINLYGITLDNDPWKYYELLTPSFIEDIWGEHLLVRIDSGCDIGQIYNDNGCDCREQIHSAIHHIQERGNGAIIHIPAQDGRGFGMATKMETEGLKRGIRVVTNKQSLQPLDTIAAAKSLLGEHFDNRSYDGVGKILGSIGVSSVILETDNRMKVAGLESANIVVRRQPTLTRGDNGSADHIKAKHAYDSIYFGEHDENAS